MSDDPRLIQARPYCSFMTLVFSLAGWGLLEAWAIIMGATWYAHIVNAVPGLILTVLTLPRPSAGAPGTAGEKKPSPGESGWTLVPPVLFLFFVGVVLGALILTGALLVLGLLAVGLCFAPWPRLAFGRHYPALSCALTSSGLMLPIAAGYHAVDLMVLPLASWIFWVCACSGLLFNAEKRRRVERRAKAARDAAGTRPAPATVRT